MTTMPIVVLKKYIDLYKKSMKYNEEEMQDLYKKETLNEEDEEYLAELRMMLFEETFIVSVLERTLKNIEEKGEDRA